MKLIKTNNERTIRLFFPAEAKAIFSLKSSDEEIHLDFSCGLTTIKQAIIFVIFARDRVVFRKN